MEANKNGVGRAGKIGAYGKILRGAGPTLVTLTVLFGGVPEASARGSLETMNLSDLHGGNGFAIDMGDGRLSSGFGVSGAGDVNGDGIDDFILKTPSYCFENPCIRTAVVFGTAAGFPARFALSNLDGTNGFVIANAGGIPYVGKPVAGVGDVNGDGIDDIAVGRSGTSYVIFGSEFGFPAIFHLASLNGDNGFSINKFASGIAGAGDVNGDGFADIVIGDDMYMKVVPGPWGDSYEYPGRAYIVFGGAEGFPAHIDVATLDGSNGFALQGTEFFGRLGFSVSGAGDVNGDGVDDVMVGAGLSYTPSGQAFVLFGRNQGFPAVVLTSELNGTNGFAVNIRAGIDTYVSSAGDINNDGFADIAIGTPYMSDASGQNYGTGQAYVIFGRGTPLPALFDVAALDGANGFRMIGANPPDFLGFTTTGIGDVNGDRVGDLIISAPGVSADGVPFSGQSYVLFGSSKGFPAQITLDYFDGFGGFALNGEFANSYSGFSAAGIGDVNADGVDDFAIGTYAEAGISEGLFGVVFGQQAPIFAAADDMRGYGEDNCVPADANIPANGASQNCGGESVQP